MKADIGFHQELQPDGKIANSWMRKWESIFGIVTVLYFAVSCYSFLSLRAKLVYALLDKVISEQTYNSVMLTLTLVDITVFVMLLVATFAPKVVQKFAEMKLGVKPDNPTEP